MVKVKICGIMNATDAKLAVKYGADALGFNFAEGPRKTTKERARAIMSSLPPFVTNVGLFVNAKAQMVHEICDFCGIDTVQLHGEERPRYLQQLKGYKIIKAFRVQRVEDLRALERYQADAFLLDARVKGKRGGTGETFNWEIANEASKLGPIIVAGGLTTENVEEAIRVAQPYAVDVASGVESDSESGKKDKQLVKEFIERAKGVR